MQSHWNDYSRHWSLLGAPLRPPPQAVASFDRELRRGEDVLLLGVTPELTGLGASLLAVDSSAEMIAAVWPGDQPTRRAVVGDWLQLPAQSGSVGAVVGDGCLSVLGKAELRIALLREIARVVHSTGRAAVRLFASPEAGETLQEVVAAARSGRIANFHAFKWHVAMALAALDPDFRVRVDDILAAVDDAFPDREQLASLTGWPLETINTIDVYRDADAVYGFPPAVHLLREASRFFRQVKLAPSGDYPLSERCPLLVMADPYQG